MLAQTLEGLAGVLLRDEEGQEARLELLPPATEAELATLAASLAVPLPTELRDALAVSRGLANSPLETLGFLDLAGFGMEDIFPHAYAVGHDGFGNFWVLDLLPGRDECGPVFYACHDPPVIAYQSPSVSDFVREAVALWQPGARSPVDIVHEDATAAIWASNSGLIERDAALASSDASVHAFARQLPSGSVIADLRAPNVGDGFSWGRYGPRAEWRRAGSERLWAAVPRRRGGLFGRLFGSRGAG